MTQKYISRKGPHNCGRGCTFRGKTVAPLPVRYGCSAVIWHDLNDETKYKRAKAKATPTCAPSEERKVRLTRWFSPTDGSLILSLSHLGVFLELQTEKKKFMSIQRKRRREDCLSAYTSKMYLETYGVEKSRRLVNLTESFDVKRNVISKVYYFLLLQKNSYRTVRKLNN